MFGISGSFSHLCAAIAPGKVESFRYNWRRAGLWNLVFLAGVLIGGFLAAHFADVSAGAALEGALQIARNAAPGR